MDQFSNNLINSVRILDLISADIECSSDLLKENNIIAKRVAFKVIYIDLCSFIDELNNLTTLLYKNDFHDIDLVNKFLLLTYKPKKILAKRDATLSKFRNTIFAHNYRDNSGEVVDPFELMLANIEEALLFEKELQYFCSIARLINILTKECFAISSDIIYSNTKTMLSNFEKVFPFFEEVKKQNFDEELKLLRSDINAIRESLKSHKDNYQIIAKKIKCKIKEPFGKH